MESKKETYYLSNGFAVGTNFEATYEEAIKICENNSCSMNTCCWLHKVGEGELGRTYKQSPLTWKFYANK